jgi:HAD superfamily hydrolase (TIGR01509 family)
VLGLEELFDLVAIEGEVGVGKPHPAIFTQVQRQLGLPSKQILFVGNSWAHDVLGALNVGWCAAWVNREGAPHPDPRSGVPELRDLRSLLEWL